MDEPEHRDFGSSERLLAYIKERSDDLERVVIPQLPDLTLTEADGSNCRYPVGMVLYYCDGRQHFLTPTDAQFLLNDGLLTRMKIRIDLWNPHDGVPPS